jgi:hypothetical protein
MPCGRARLRLPPKPCRPWGLWVSRRMRTGECPPRTRACRPRRCCAAGTMVSASPGLTCRVYNAVCLHVRGRAACAGTNSRATRLKWSRSSTGRTAKSTSAARSRRSTPSSLREPTTSESEPQGRVVPMKTSTRAASYERSVAVSIGQPARPKLSDSGSARASGSAGVPRPRSAQSNNSAPYSQWPRARRSARARLMFCNRACTPVHRPRTP